MDTITIEVREVAEKKQLYSHGTKTRSPAQLDSPSGPGPIPPGLVAETHFRAARSP